FRTDLGDRVPVGIHDLHVDGNQVDCASKHDLTGGDRRGEHDAEHDQPDADSCHGENSHGVGWHRPRGQEDWYHDQSGFAGKNPSRFGISTRGSVAWSSTMSCGTMPFLKSTKAVSAYTSFGVREPSLNGARGMARLM